jgi:hypothetical protein
MRPSLAPRVGAVAAPGAGAVLPWAEVDGVAGGVAVCADPGALGAWPAAVGFEPWAVDDPGAVAPAEPEAPTPVEAPGVGVAAGGDAVEPAAGDEGLEDGWV